MKCGLARRWCFLRLSFVARADGHLGLNRKCRRNPTTIERSFRGRAARRQQEPFAGDRPWKQPAARRNGSFPIEPWDAVLTAGLPSVILPSTPSTRGFLGVSLERRFLLSEGEPPANSYPKPPPFFFSLLEKGWLARELTLSRVSSRSPSHVQGAEFKQVSDAHRFNKVRAA